MINDAIRRELVAIAFSKTETAPNKIAALKALDQLSEPIAAEGKSLELHIHFVDGDGYEHP